MDRPRRDQEMIVLPGRELVYIRLSPERVAMCLGCLQFPYHGIAIYVVLDAEIDASILAGIQKVIAFVLGVLHPELVPDILRFRVNLQREVSAAHGIEEIKANGEFSSKPSVNTLAEQLARVQQRQVHRRNFHTGRAEPEQQAVLLRNAVEA